jgi:hypothetical protein
MFFLNWFVVKTRIGSSGFSFFKSFLLFIWIIEILFYIFGTSKRTAIRFDNRFVPF